MRCLSDRNAAQLLKVLLSCMFIRRASVRAMISRDCFWAKACSRHPFRAAYLLWSVNRPKTFVISCFREVISLVFVFQTLKAFESPSIRHWLSTFSTCACFNPSLCAFPSLINSSTFCRSSVASSTAALRNCSNFSSSSTFCRSALASSAAALRCRSNLSLSSACLAFSAR